MDKAQSMFGKQPRSGMWTMCSITEADTSNWKVQDLDRGRNYACNVHLPRTVQLREYVVIDSEGE